MRATSDIHVLRCGACGTLDPGPREFCAVCGSDQMAAHPVVGQGTLVSWTVIRRPPKSFKSAGPYAVAVVNLDSQVRITGRLDAISDHLKPGMPVSFVGMADSYHVFTERAS